MMQKITSIWDRVDTWYWISGARELCELSWKGVKFFGCFFVSMLLMMGGTMKLQEVRNIDPNSPLSILLTIIGTLVVMRGSISIAKSGLL